MCEGGHTAVQSKRCINGVALVMFSRSSTISICQAEQGDLVAK